MVSEKEGTDPKEEVTVSEEEDPEFGQQNDDADLLKELNKSEETEIGQRSSELTNKKVQIWTPTETKELLTELDTLQTSYNDTVSAVKDFLTNNKHTIDNLMDAYIQDESPAYLFANAVKDTFKKEYDKIVRLKKEYNDKEVEVFKKIYGDEYDKTENILGNYTSFVQYDVAGGDGGCAIHVLGYFWDKEKKKLNGEEIWNERINPFIKYKNETWKEYLDNFPVTDESESKKEVAAGKEILKGEEMFTFAQIREHWPEISAIIVNPWGYKEMWDFWKHSQTPFPIILQKYEGAEFNWKQLSPRQKHEFLRAGLDRPKIQIASYTNKHFSVYENSDVTTSEPSDQKFMKKITDLYKSRLNEYDHELNTILINDFAHKNTPRIISQESKIDEFSQLLSKYTDGKLDINTARSAYYEKLYLKTRSEEQTALQAALASDETDRDKKLFPDLEIYINIRQKFELQRIDLEQPTFDQESTNFFIVATRETLSVNVTLYYLDNRYFLNDDDRTFNSKKATKILEASLDSNSKLLKFQFFDGDLKEFEKEVFTKSYQWMKISKEFEKDNNKDCDFGGNFYIPAYRQISVFKGLEFAIEGLVSNNELKYKIDLNYGKIISAYDIANGTTFTKFQVKVQEHLNNISAGLYEKFLNAVDKDRYLDNEIVLKDPIEFINVCLEIIEFNAGKAAFKMYVTDQLTAGDKQLEGLRGIIQTTPILKGETLKIIDDVHEEQVKLKIEAFSANMLNKAAQVLCYLLFGMTSENFQQTIQRAIIRLNQYNNDLDLKNMYEGFLKKIYIFFTKLKSKKLRTSEQATDIITHFKNNLLQHGEFNDIIPGFKQTCGSFKSSSFEQYFLKNDYKENSKLDTIQVSSKLSTQYIPKHRFISKPTRTSTVRVKNSSRC